MFDKSATRWAWLMPLMFFQGYLSFVLFAFLAGPWPWDQPNTGLLVAYLLAAQVAIAAGYLAGWRRVWSVAQSTTAESRALWAGRGIAFFNIALWVNLAILIPTSLSRSGTVIPDVLTGISDTGKVYNDNFERLNQGNIYVFIEYLRMLLSPFLFGFYPLLIAFWNKVETWKRGAGIFIIIFNMAIYISVGVNKGVVDNILLLPWLLYLAKKAASGGLRVPPWAFRAVFIVMALGFLVFFGRGQEERAGNVGADGVFYTGVSLIRAHSSIMGEVLNDSQRIAYESLMRYLTQGYYALGLSFDVPHSSTLGFGNSMFLARNMDSIFATNFFTTGSLPGQMEIQLGFPQFSLWHSIYTWLASDVGHVGALFVIAAFSYIFSVAWGRALVLLDYRHMIMASIMLIMFYYIPGNNQIFQSGESALAFLIMGGWMFLDRFSNRNRSERGGGRWRAAQAK